MKNLITSLVCIFTVFYTNANNETPIISKIEFANLEVSRLDGKTVGNALYKRNDCKTGGFSYFSPFYEVKGLENYVVNSTLLKDEVLLEARFNYNNYKIVLSNFVISDDRKSAFFETKYNNVIYKSVLRGAFLTKEFILNSFNSGSSSSLLNNACPPCGYIAAVAIVGVVTYLCLEAQGACAPCGGTLTVGACSCSCTPSNGKG